MVPVVPGGRSIPLNFHNRKDYVDAVTAFKLHEMNKQVGSIVTKTKNCVYGELTESFEPRCEKTGLRGF